MRMRQTLADWEVAFEQETALQRQRREELRRRAAARARARQISRTQKTGKVRFSVLFTALTLTVVTVIVVMFEVLAMLMGAPS